ncbi:toll/interleukin-1 receptor domain-containing protein [Hirschia litorea]|uniref:Toll/interleukin-1 receptor domain-containing protein n=1 Tax=Hirschia litorea TaxID=1199156 RepID=A0ABW2IJA2_9PROT
MSEIFISHSNEDNSEAKALRHWLIESGGWAPSQIFIDLSEFVSGDRWRERLNFVGHNCQAVVVCLSDNWIGSPECLREFNHAESSGKPIFPVIIKPLATSIPDFVASIQFADISTLNARESGLENLRLGLTRAQISPKHFMWPPENEPDRKPYRGLRSLEQQDAAIYFGRDSHIIAGLDKLRQMRGGLPRRILTIAAASGAGKSSFLKAGLLSRLQRDTENFITLPIFRPRQDAMSGETGVLKAISVNIEEAGSNQIIERSIKSLNDIAAQRVRHLERLAKAAGETQTLRAPTIVLPIDQAEELFSVDNHSGKDAINLLTHCLTRVTNLVVIATIRSDSLSLLQKHEHLARQLELFNLPPLPPQAFKEVIEGPAGLSKKPLKIEPALTEKLIKDLDTADALPLLAFTLERLTEEYVDNNLLELIKYNEGLGGLDGAINIAVEAVFKRAEADPDLPSSRSELDRLARQIFIPWLVQLDEANSSPMRRVSFLSSLPIHLHKLVAHFVDERLLVQSIVKAESCIEVSHEAVLRHWHGLSAWIGEERFQLEHLHQVQQAAKLWRKQQTQEIEHKSDLLVHSGERLTQALDLLKRADLKSLIGPVGEVYLNACHTHQETIKHKEEEQIRKAEEKEKQRIFWQRFTLATISIAFLGLLWGGWQTIRKIRNDARIESLITASVAGQYEDEGDYLRASKLVILGAQDTLLSPASKEAFSRFRSNAQKFSNHTLSIKHEGHVYGAVLSKDGTRILTWNRDNTARLWDAQSGHQIGSPLKHVDYVNNSLFSGGVQIIGASFIEDETRILTWSNDSIARVWDTQTKQQIGPTLQYEENVNDALFSEDGTRILTWKNDSTAGIYDVQTGQHIGPALQYENEIKGAVFNKGKTRVLTWGDDDAARIWDVYTGQQIGPVLKHEDWVSGATFSKDGTRILTWSGDNTTRLWDTQTGQQIGPTMEHTSKVEGAILNKDGTYIFTITINATLRFDAQTGREVWPALIHNDNINGASLNADETRILTWGDDDTARIWDAQTGKQIGPTLKHEDWVSSATFSKDGTRILTLSGGDTVRIWNVQNERVLKHEDWIKGVSFNEDETRILTWGDDDTARIWDTHTGLQVGTSLKHEDGINGAVFYKGETRVLTLSGNNTVRTWDVQSGQQIGSFTLKHVGETDDVVFSQNRTRVITWSWDNTARIWDVYTGQQIGTVLKHEDGINGAVLSKDGTRILTWSWDNTARIWGVYTGQQIGPALKHEDHINGASFNEDETLILTWGDDHAARIWDTHTGLQVGTSLKHEDGINGAVFNKGETRVLTWGNDHAARIWDIRTGLQVGASLKHEDEINGAVFNRDGTSILTWSNDNSARIWDTQTGLQVGSALQHGNWVSGAVFSKDETHILTWSWDNTVRIWDITWTGLIKPQKDDFDRFCNSHLIASLEQDKNGKETPYIRLIDQNMIDKASILRGRLGEDVCDIKAPPFYESPLRPIFDWIFQDGD